MPKLAKSLISIVAIIVLIVHFGFISVYCFPHINQKAKVYFLSKFYVYPVFQQNWVLFTPAPNVERKIFVRYQKGGSFLPWTDILGDEIIKRKQNCFSGNEALVLLFSNSAIYQLNSLDTLPSQVIASNYKSNEFKVLKFEVEQYLKLKYLLNTNTVYELLLYSKGQESKAFYFKSILIK